MEKYDKHTLRRSRLDSCAGDRYITRRRAVSEYKYHVRNPIKRHGAGVRDHFTIIPNELVRDTELSQHAYRLAIVIRSHANDYEVSVKSLAEMLGWCPKRTKKARDELVAARWLAMREYKTAKGTRAYEEYHLNVSRKFTEEEAASLNQAVTFYTRLVSEDGLQDEASCPTPSGVNKASRPISMGRETEAPWGEPPYTHRASGPTKEYEPEDQGENTKGENHSRRQALTTGLEDEDEWSRALASSQADGADPLPEKKLYTLREWKEIEAAGGVEAYEAMQAASQEDEDSASGRPEDAADTVRCWGCKTNGRDACSVHSPHLHPVSA